MQPIPLQAEHSVAKTTEMLDISHEKCPMTFVRTRLALDALPPGSLLAVRLRGAEPLQNVTKSVKALGHCIVSEQSEAEGIVVLTVQKKAEGHEA